MKLYNMIFPVWLLWIFPTMWLIIMPANLIIDGLVIWLTLQFLKIADIKTVLKTVIWRTWVCGFLADFVSCLLLFSVNLIEFSPESQIYWWWNNNMMAVNYNVFANIYAFTFTTFALFISAYLIYWFNSRFCLKEAPLSAKQKKQLAISLAVFTAPYVFFLPSSLIF